MPIKCAASTVLKAMSSVCYHLGDIFFKDLVYLFMLAVTQVVEQLSTNPRVNCSIPGSSYTSTPVEVSLDNIPKPRDSADMYCLAAV